MQHDVPWEPGNHEDGWLIGFNNLVRIWEQLIAADDWL